VGDKATIQNATLLPGAVVASGATVRDQVVVEKDQFRSDLLN